MSVHDLSKKPLSSLTDDELRELLLKAVDLQRADRQENQILYYQPVSPRVMQMHECDAKIVAIGGGNGCEVAGSRVVTLAGMVRIEDVRPGDRVLGRGQWPLTVSAIYRSPQPVPTFRVTTKRGFTFECSGDHLSRVASCRNREWHNARDVKRSSAKWQKVDSLEGTTLDDWKFIALATGGPVFPKHCKISQDEAYFLGMMIGDGSYNGTGYRRNVLNVTLSEKDTAIVDRVVAFLKKRGITVKPRARKGSRVSIISFSNKKFGEWFFGPAGMIKAVGENKVVPESVWLGSASVIGSFLRGLFDTDGCATTKPSAVLVNRAGGLMRDVHILLMRLGILSSLRFDKTINTKSSKGIWRLEVTGSSLGRFRKFVGFTCAYKADRIPHRRVSGNPPNYRNWDRIRSVERMADRHVHGLTIDRVPEYVSSGFLQHNSSKTESALVELISCATGVFPEKLKHLADAKWRGPIQTRIVCESLTTVLHPVILPKLQWWRWSGVDQPGGDRGHWGWIPKTSLIDGDWQKSWSEKLRTLRLICRDPNTMKMVGESTVQCMSVDQDPSDFASGDFHIVLHDEPPSLAIWRENEARTMRTAGRMLLAMTWPDDPSIAVDWIFNEVYEPGLNPNEKRVKWFTLSTFDNKNLRQTEVHAQAQAWSDEVRKVRIEGQPLRFSNRIHPDFTDFTKTWCFSCDKSVIPASGGPKVCPNCNSPDLEDYNHVQEFSESGSWPTIFLLDPHPRKPHMMIWVQVDPSDDLWQVAEASVEGEPLEVKAKTDRIESDFNLFVAQRIMDPNMGASPSGTKREISWQDEFRSAGLSCDLADDSEVGRKRLNGYLRPDKATRRPRFHVHPRNKDTIYQINRYVWDDFKRGMEKDLKQTPKTKYDDFPTLLKYCMNSDPTFNLLKYGAPVFRRQGQRKGAY